MLRLQPVGVTVMAVQCNNAATLILITEDSIIIIIIIIISMIMQKCEMADGLLARA